MDLTFRNNFFYKNLRHILFVAGLIFFVVLIVRSWNEAQAVLQTLYWPLFLFSILIAMIDNILLSFLFQQLLRKYNFNVDYIKIGQMFFYGQMAKYIPGRFWSIFYHASFLKRPGSIKSMFFANLDLTGLSMLRNVVIATVLIIFQRSHFFAFFAIVFGTALFWFLSHSYWLVTLFHMIFRSRTTFNAVSPNSPKINNLVIILIGVFNLVTFLLANFLMMQSSFGFTAAEASPYIAYFGIAWVVGALSFIFPAGIGVREITFIFLAQVFSQGQPVAIEALAAIAVVYRLWQILLEFGSIGMGYTFLKLQKRTEVNDGF